MRNLCSRRVNLLASSKSFEKIIKSMPCQNIIIDNSSIERHRIAEFQNKELVRIKRWNGNLLDFTFESEVNTLWIMPIFISCIEHELE